MILIISNREDVTSDFVVREISRRGLPFARLNTDEFPSMGLGTSSFGFNAPPRKYIRWKNRDTILDFNQVSSILYRRPTPPVADERIIEPAVRQFCINESYDFLRGLWLSLDCYWMSHPDAIRKAEHKVYQLGVAQSIPFHIPKTLITNDPMEVRTFFLECNKRMVVKPVYLGFIDAPQTPQYVFTSVVSEADLEVIEDIQVAPAIFQEKIIKQYDVRVTVVGEKVFAAKIRAENLPPNIPDWRFLPIDQLSHEELILPPELEGACIKLVKHLGLDFGAIDFAVDMAGNYIFFEINPNGQWAWLETVLNLPISQSIVDRLSNH
jgi:glutathione synthase/RimK-type ligase-like ATP-grasp enzyme